MLAGEWIRLRTRVPRSEDFWDHKTSSETSESFETLRFSLKRYPGFAFGPFQEKRVP